MSFWKKKSQELGESSEYQPTESLESTESSPVLTAKTEEKAAKGTPAAPSESRPSVEGTSESSFLNNIQQQDSTYSKVRSALSAGTVIQGKLSFDTPVRIDGKLSGEVYSSKVLIVGETAQITATIEASSLVIMGKIKGTIKATERVQICKGADVEGAIISPSLTIESGAVFNGTSEMSQSVAGTAKSEKETKIYANENIDLEQMLNKTAAPSKGKSEEKPKTGEGSISQ